METKKAVERERERMHTVGSLEGCKTDTKMRQDRERDAKIEKDVERDGDEERERENAHSRKS